MEVCMPRHTLEIFARGLGVWTGFPGTRRAARSCSTWPNCSTTSIRRSACFSTTAALRYSVPYTIFGPYRAAIYVGDMYLVLNATEPIRTLTRHFDNLIRAADVNAHETAASCAGRWREDRISAAG